MNSITISRIIIHIGAILPLFWLSFVIILGGEDLGADPAKEIQHFLGFVAITLFLLLFCLRFFVTVRRALKYQILHRPLGLWAFSYLILHILSYFLLELGGDLGLFFSEITGRYYLMIGVFSLLLFLLALLAVSPIGGIFAKLGFNLHNLSYLAVILGMVHYFLSTKGIELTAIIYNSLTILAILGVYFYKKKLSKPR